MVMKKKKAMAKGGVKMMNGGMGMKKKKAYARGGAAKRK